jgi:phosphatidylglycerophosphatase A
MALSLGQPRHLPAGSLTSPPSAQARPNGSRPQRDRLILFIAQGLGSGRLPAAPGTWGSVVGVLWFLVLLAPGHFWLYLLGTSLGVAAGIWFCDRGERILGQKDPGSIVLDEIVAMPIVYLSWTSVAWFQTGGCSIPELAQAGAFGWLLAIGFLAFRLLDALKPWPIRGLQRAKGGWGVVVDDLGAAVGATLILFGWMRAFGGASPAL